MADAGRVAVMSAGLPGGLFSGGISGCGLLAVTLAEPSGFSHLETLLVIFCAVFSAGLFFWRLGPILRNILNSKKDADFSLSPLGRRVWSLSGRFYARQRLSRKDPLPGLAHAFVFWGFLAFALVSLNHFASGLGLGFLAPHGYVGGFYFGFAAVWALLVAVSIAGLFVRRFFVRTVWLGRRSHMNRGLLRS